MQETVERQLEREGKCQLGREGARLFEGGSGKRAALAARGNVAQHQNGICRLWRIMLPESKQHLRGLSRRRLRSAAIPSASSYTRLRTSGYRSSIARVSGYYHRGIDRGADVSAPRPIAVARMRKMREDASGIVAVSPEYRTGTEGIGRLRTFGRSQKEVESGVVFGEGMQSGRREGVHLGSIPGWGAAFTATCRCEHLYLEADSHSTWLVS
jgi:hypothetical protein